MFSLILTAINLGIVIYWVIYVYKLNKEFNEFLKYMKKYNNKETEEIK